MYKLLILLAFIFIGCAKSNLTTQQATTPIPVPSPTQYCAPVMGTDWVASGTAYDLTNKAAIVSPIVTEINMASDPTYIETTVASQVDTSFWTSTPSPPYMDFDSPNTLDSNSLRLSIVDNGFSVLSVDATGQAIGVHSSCNVLGVFVQIAIFDPTTNTYKQYAALETLIPN